MNRLHLCSLAAALAVTLAPAAHADSFQVSYLGAGVQASSNSTSVETFDNANPTTSNGVSSYTTSFANSGVTGTYSGTFYISGANVYGGANGTGSYITTGTPNSTTANTYTLTLSQNVNYFGLWFSALDAGNVMSFYNGSTLLYSFGAQQFINGVGSCANGNAYCGNPNLSSGYTDSGEQFAFINFYDGSGSFNKITFSETANAGGAFESDNHTLGNLSSAPNGTNLAPVPEPSSLALLGTGITGIAGLIRRRVSR